jgi:hypothetical protein
LKFKEISDIGFNLMTFSAVVIVAIALWQLQACIRQAYTIWKHRSIESVSTTFAVAFAVILFAFGVYGAVTHSLVLVINGLVSLPAIAICVGIFVFGETKKTDILVVIAGVVSLGTLLLPIDTKPIFLFFAMTVVIPLIFQLRRLYVVGKRGVVSGELLTTIVVKNTFFVVFAFTLPGGEPILQKSSPFWLSLSVWLLVKWIRCPKSIE